MEIVIPIIAAVVGVAAGAGGIFAYNKSKENGGKDKAEDLVRKAKREASDIVSAAKKEAAEIAEKVDGEFNACMDDDFNTALALSNLFGYFKEMKKLLSIGKSGELFAALSYAIQIRKTYSLLGLFNKSAKEYLAWYESKNASDIPAEVKAIAEERFAARQNRDWAKSDELRDKLAALGFAVKDSKTGYELTKNS